MNELPTIKPTPELIIRHGRFVRQDGWQLDHISLCPSGNIAVSGHRDCTHRSFVCVYSTIDSSDSRHKPALLYEKEFEEKYSGLLPWRQQRLISFMEPNSTEIVTCQDDEVQVIHYNRDIVLRSRKVNGYTRCLSVSESEIFIGLLYSYIVNIYDKDLDRIKSIELTGIGGYEYPWDITAAADRLYVCTYEGSAIAYRQNNGNIVTEYDKDNEAWSVTVNVQIAVVAVLWYDGRSKRQVSVYSFSDNYCLVVVSVDHGVSRIRISDQGRVVTGNAGTGEVKIYDLASILTFSHMKEILVSSVLKRSDCEKLVDFFAMGGEEMNTILNSGRPTATLLLALEEKGVIKPSNVDRLEEAFLGLKMTTFYQIVNLYQKLRDQTTFYDRFLATLSTHLTASLPGDLCDSFHMSDEIRRSILSNQNPGLSLLLALDEMGIIKASEVRSLENPFKELGLVQAVAKLHEYQQLLEEEKGQLLQTAPQNFEDKKRIFVDLIKRKIKSWYETMTPVPWKKSCRWKSTDLFVGSGLILTDSKANRNVQKVDEQCKLNYKDIFSHPKLKSEIRIILEGDPGAGKTMLSSQLAYDWSQGNISDADILIFLPLKFVEDKTLIQAIDEFYIPANMPISVKDIESILASETEAICLLLDGLEEYSTGGRMRAKESSEVMKVMKKEKYSNCKVVITSRSDFAHDLPECPLLKIGRFGEKERDSYIAKLYPDNIDKQQEIKRVIQDNPFILDLCSVPLLFVLAVHNIESMSLADKSQLNKISPFMRSMILTLCSSTTVKHEVDGIRSKFFKSEKMTLGELSFNGLCKGRQQLSWQKEFMKKKCR